MNRALLVLCAVLCFPAAAWASYPEGVYVEDGAPAGRYEGQKPRGVVINIHGGSWVLVGREWAAANASVAMRYRRLGYHTVNTDYRAGADSLKDVVAVYDEVRRRFGSKIGVCAHGESAGGHLAMMLSLKRPSLDCVSADSPPVDCLRAKGPISRFCHMFFAATPEGLRGWSPARFRLRTPTMMMVPEGDPILPFSENGALMRRTNPQVRLIKLPAGDAPFMHAPVDARSLARARALEKRFIARAMIG